MRARELTPAEIDAVSGGTRRGGGVLAFVTGVGGNGGNGYGGIALLSGNSTSIGVLTKGQSSGSGSAANGTGGNGGAGISLG